MDNFYFKKKKIYFLQIKMWNYSESDRQLEISPVSSSPT